MSTDISDSPLDFEITRVDCNNERSVCTEMSDRSASLNDMKTIQVEEVLMKIWLITNSVFWSFVLIQAILEL